MGWPTFLYYSTPSKVTIASKSLFFVAVLVYIAAVGVPLYTGIQNEAYLEAEKPQARMNTYPSLTQYNNYNPTISGLSYCDPTRTAYEEAGWKFSYRVNGCKKFNAGELHSKTSDEIFVRTYRQVNEVNENTGTNTLTNYFAVGVENIAIPFNLHYFTSKDKESGPATTVVDSTGAIRHTFGPKQTVSLTVQEWLDVAGVSLDSYNQRITQTVFTNDIVPFPLRRMTGLKIYLKVDFGMKGGAGHAVITTEVGDEWTTLGDDIDFYAPGHYVNYYDSAVMFKFQYGGEIRYLNWNYVFIWLAIISVLASRANAVINYVAMYGPFMNREFNRRIMKTHMSAKRELARNMAHMIMAGVQNNCFNVKFENPLYLKKSEVITLIDVVYGRKRLIMYPDGSGYLRTKTGNIPFDKDMVADNSDNLTRDEIMTLTEALFEIIDVNGKLAPV
eukprot:TRINITY_DN3832_c0_g1_i1.p1 TRINITY_DN3832_c0_g1~~TRINITY_DN3832_c0_g1_i1.p1  ORF type:complete len:445 (-),score=127.98 TRINITY_DN3832_c0_g1_i1:42-1376(-)